MRTRIGWEGLGENLRRKGEDEGELAGQFSGTFYPVIMGLSWTFDFLFLIYIYWLWGTYVAK